MSRSFTRSAFGRRDFLKASAAGVAAVSFPNLRASAESPNEQIGIGLIGAGGRGAGLAGGFHQLPGARIVAVADPDEKRSGGTAAKYQAKAYRDMRQLLEDPAVDAVVIATCNHWHCLAAIWAMQAGKDVYVEKPLSHSQWEGRQVVNAARKYNKVVQLGTQQRSDPMQAEIKQFLHEDKSLGDIKYVQTNRLGPRGPIGKRSTPLPIPSEVDYDLWLGPAQDQPIFRDHLHYDWHWDFNTGSGEMGNWGVHVLDDVRNVVYRDTVSTPQRIMAVGGRVAWNDAGNTPNVHYAYFDTGGIPALIALSNLLSSPTANRGGWFTKAGRPVEGPSVGYVVACEGGYYLGQRGSGRAVDLEGKRIRTFKGGDRDRLHKQNFLDAIRSRNWSSLNAEIQIGHHSSGWCNLANVAYRCGEAYSPEVVRLIEPDSQIWGELLEEMTGQLAAFDIKPSDTDIRMSPVLHHDPETERFTGEHSSLANEFVKRQYRPPYIVPEVS